MMNTIDPVYLTNEIRSIEQSAFALPDPPDLMEKAGREAAETAKDKFNMSATQHVLVLAGTGNNGGDAFVAARYLKNWGHNVTVVCCEDPNRLPADSRKTAQTWLDIGGEMKRDIPEQDNWNLVIDGLFGIGLQPDRPITEPYLNWINQVNAMTCPVLSLDIPSGLSSDEGDVNDVAIIATLTVTFIGLKPGLLTQFGPQHCGEIVVCDLDLDATAIISPHIWAINQKMTQMLLPPPRPANSHKGHFGSVGILGGNDGMTGAPILTGRAALFLGAGRVFLSILSQTAPTVDMLHPEVMFRSPAEIFDIDQINCLVAGPGMSIDESTYRWMQQMLNSHLPLVLDADALNHIAFHSELARQLKLRKIPAVLTPHPAEAARLLDIDVTAVQSNRIRAAKAIAMNLECFVVLKGAGSICALPSGRCFINTSGNPGLSSAGTGDVLAGMIGALIAQGLKPDDAMLLAVYLHGAAADQLLHSNNGPLGMTASEILSTARLLLNSWIYKQITINP